MKKKSSTTHSKFSEPSAVTLHYLICVLINGV